jgi:hypothetical protein
MYRYYEEPLRLAVLMGGRTFEMRDPDSYDGSYEFQVPIFVLTHHPPSVASKQDEHLTFTLVTDGEQKLPPAIRQLRWSTRPSCADAVRTGYA